MEIVKLTEDDKEQIIHLDKRAFAGYDIPSITPDEVDKLMQTGFALGIKDNGILMAIIQVIESKDVWAIWTIATLPDKQRLGLADKLLKEVLRLARGARVRKITAAVKPDNEKSIMIFTKHGFRKKAYVKDYHGKGIDRTVFEYTIR